MTRFTRSFLVALLLLMLFGARALISDRVWAESLQSVVSVFPAKALFTGDDESISHQQIFQDSLVPAPRLHPVAATDSETMPDPSRAITSFLRSDSEIKRAVFSLLKNEQYGEARGRLAAVLDSNSYADDEDEIRTLLRLVRELEREKNPADRKRLLDALSGANSMAQEITGVSKDLEELSAKLKNLEPSQAELAAGAAADPALSAAAAAEPESPETGAADEPSEALNPQAGATAALQPGLTEATQPVSPKPPLISAENERLRSDLRTICSARTLSGRGKAGSRANSVCLETISRAFDLSAGNSGNSVPDSALAALALDAVSRLKFGSSHSASPDSLAETEMVTAIGRAVSSDDDGVAWNAAAALGQLYPITHQTLISLLHSQKAGDRSRAAFALGLARADGAIGVLALALSDEDPAVRSESIRAIRRIGTPAAEETFSSYAGREVSQIAARLRTASSSLSPQPGNPADGAPVEIAPAVSALHEAAALGDSAAQLAPDIAALLSSPQVELKTEALETLAAINASATAPQVAELLESDDSAVTTVAAEVLVHFGEPSVAPVTDLLNSSDKPVRLRATAVLGRLGKNGVTAREKLETVGQTDQSELQASASRSALRYIDKGQDEPTRSGQARSKHSQDR